MTTGLPIVDSPIGRLALRLLDQLLRRRPSGNVLLCPPSIGLALGLAEAAAAGVTRDELRAVLDPEGRAAALEDYFRDLRSALVRAGPPVEIDLAVAMWATGSVPIRSEFITRAHDVFGATAASLPSDVVEATGRVNDWVRASTRTRIPELLRAEQLGGASGPLLTTAMSFRAPWTTPFVPSTAHHDFVLRTGDRRPTPMMVRRAVCPYAEAPDYQAVALDYAGGEAALYVILPRAGASVDLGDWWQRRPALEATDVEVLLPRFSVGCSVDLAEPLVALGLRSAFRPGADFRRMAGSGEHLRSAISAVRVDVDEQGTEAAGATAIVMGRTARRVPRMVVDHEFLLALACPPEGELLLVGKVVDPTSPSRLT